MIRVELPIKTVSLLNMRDHFRVTSQRKSLHRRTTTLALIESRAKAPELPVVVTLTRLSPGMLDEHDNLPSAFKHIVDGVAAWIGIDDADPRVTWKYAQQKCKRGQFGVILEIESHQKSENPAAVTAGPSNQAI